MVGPRILKSHTRIRSLVLAEEWRAVTLRFLASGETFGHLMYHYKIHKTMISKIAPEVCQAIYDALKDKYFDVTKREEEWQKLLRILKKDGTCLTDLQLMMENISQSYHTYQSVQQSYSWIKNILLLGFWISPCYGRYFWYMDK